MRQNEQMQQFKEEIRNLTLQKMIGVQSETFFEKPELALSIKEPSEFEKAPESTRNVTAHQIEPLVISLVQTPKHIQNLIEPNSDRSEVLRNTILINEQLNVDSDNLLLQNREQRLKLLKFVSLYE